MYGCVTCAVAHFLGNREFEFWYAFQCAMVEGSWEKNAWQDQLSVLSPTLPSLTPSLLSKNLASHFRKEAAVPMP